MSQWIINHIFSVLIIIAYYYGLAFSTADAAPECLLLKVSGPLGDAVAVSLE
jgi:hypothetical protein